VRTQTRRGLPARKLLPAAAAAFFVFADAASVWAQDAAEAPKLTLENLYHPRLRKPWVGGLATQLDWLSDGVLQQTRFNREKGAIELLKLDPTTFRATPLLDEAATTGLLTGAGASEADARKALSSGALVWNEARDGFVVDVAEDLYYVDVKAAEGRRLTRAAGSEDEAIFSPDGARVAYLRGNDVYAATVKDGVETRLTTTGTPTLLNGRLDWVYQEELYGRGEWRGFWWSPDGARIAYLQLDESKVPSFTVLDHRPLHQEAHTANYPKVGDPNPTARLGVVAATGGETTWMRNPKPEIETLISNVGWTPDGRVLAQWQDGRPADAPSRDDEGVGRTLADDAALLKGRQLPLAMRSRRLPPRLSPRGGRVAP
jgi:dipeptidyl-peptidase 4